MAIKKPVSSQHLVDDTLKLCALLIGFVLVGGTVGYRLIEQWPWLDSLYMTVITISTVGFTEVHSLSDAGRVHTMILVFIGVGTLAVTLSVIFENFFQRQLRFIMEKRSMSRTIESMKNHTIVCGFGRMGRVIATSLKEASHPVVIIEQVPATAEKIEKDGFAVVNGNAVDEDTLERAGIARATALVATLGSDADNLFLTVTARGMKADLNIIARAEDENNRRKFTLAGASRVVSPFAIGANHIVRVLTRPSVVDFVDLVSKDDNIKFEVFQVDIDSGNPFAGKTLSEGRVRQELGGMVLAIRKPDGHLVFDPSPHLRINTGDSLFVIGTSPGGIAPVATPE